MAVWSTSFFVVMPLCAAVFLLVLTLVGPPQAMGLDAAWTEVLAWGLLHGAQWGRDLIFAYGPLGLFHPGASYVSGAFDWYVAGNIALPAAFALTVALLLHRATFALICFFALAFATCFPIFPGDLCSALTVVFGTTFLMRCLDERATARFCGSVLLLAPLFGALALTKFSVIPIWAVCVAALAGISLIERNVRCLFMVLAAFPLALVVAWVACGQQLVNLPFYLSNSLELAYGYVHAMGVRPAYVVDFCGISMLAAFVGTCGFHAWRARMDRSAVVTLGQAAVVAVLFWLSFFTRGDSFHWPGFFIAMSLLPLVLLRSPRLRGMRSLSAALVLVVLTSTGIVFFQTPGSMFPGASARIRQALHDLTHLDDLKQVREAQWRQAVESAGLPKVHERIGNGRVDMLTWQQGMIIVNGFNYAPRPAFQSYFAYTSKLARLNEAHFLGDKAPEFVVFALEHSDNRFLTSEDGLALIAIAKRYRPVMVEKGFLLLEQDKATSAATVSVRDSALQAVLGAEVALGTDAQPTIGFVRVELNPFGKMYTMLFREPALNMVVRTADGGETRHRLIRLAAASGFLLSPLVQSSQDWIKLYLSKPLPRIQSIRVDTESDWERLLFERRFAIALQPTDVLHPDAAHPSQQLGSQLYPEFNVAPAASTNLRIIVEQGVESAFLQAPDSIQFLPAPGNYVASGTFGIQNAALENAECARHDPDGIGVSLVFNRAGNEKVLWHGEIDPFHVAQDRGPQHFRVEGIDIGEGDILRYRVDAGHGGQNVSCDWSYFRDFVLRRRGDVGSARVAPGAIFGDGFE